MDYNKNNITYMINTDRNFMIFNVSELDTINFNEVLETSVDTVRKSLDNKTFVKWDGETPQCVLDLTTKEGPFTYEEILFILESNNWNDINQS
jgi:hypothetical protein